MYKENQGVWLCHLVGSRGAQLQVKRSRFNPQAAVCPQQQSEDDTKSRAEMNFDSDSDAGEHQLSFRQGSKNKIQKVGLDHIGGTQNRGLQAKNLSRQKLNPRKRPTPICQVAEGRYLSVIS